MARTQNVKIMIVGFFVLILMVLGIYASIYAYSDGKNENAIFTGYFSMNDMLKEASDKVYRKKEDYKEIKEEVIGESSKNVESKKPSTNSEETTKEAPKAYAGKTSSGKKNIVGYYAGWSAYSGFTPDRIDASKLTHIKYAFANIGTDLKIMLGDSNIDPSNFSKLNELKSKNKNLKILISVGGWTWSDKFSDVALTESSRQKFADSVVEFLVKYKLDGVDLDWEYPVSGGLPKNSKRPEDKVNFTLLLKTLREKLDQQGTRDGKRYVLTFSGGTSKSYVNNIELNKISKIVDFGSIMTYDIHGNWDKYTDFNAPLYNVSGNSPQHKWSVDSAINLWLNAGFPADKLNMGLPFYGYKYDNVKKSNNGFLQSYSGGKSIAYKEVVRLLNANGFKKHFHSEAKVPWIYNGSTFISYDDKDSLAIKAQYIKTKGLGGAMIWELSQDSNGILLNTIFNSLK